MNMVSLEGVSKSFSNSRAQIEVLRETDLQIQQGERIAIVGPSGSGKSTLLSLLAGLDTPTAGTITIADRVLSKMDESELSQFRADNLSIVFQRFHLMSALSALENVELPLDIQKRTNSRQLAMEALKAVGLENRHAHFPRELSGGECQRVAIARALVAKPRLLLADEPSGNLDTETGQLVMDLLFDLIKAEQTTLVLVTHNTELAQRCDRVLTLKNGAITS